MILLRRRDSRRNLNVELILLEGCNELVGKIAFSFELFFKMFCEV